MMLVLLQSIYILIATVLASSITKQIQSPYIAIKGFTSNINYIKKTT